MAFTLVGYDESQTPTADTYTAVAALADPHVFVTGDDIRVPEGMANILASYGLDAGLTHVAENYRLVSPSLRALYNPEYPMEAEGTVSPSRARYNGNWNNPIPVSPAEALTFEYRVSGTGTANRTYGLVWLGDGVQGVVAGDIRPARFTTAAGSGTEAWANKAITFTQTLPVGRYQVVGMKLYGATSVAGRLVFPGGIWRPGVIVTPALPSASPFPEMAGMTGVWGEFHTNAPPTLDALQGTAAALTGFLYLIRVG